MFRRSFLQWVLGSVASAFVGKEEPVSGVILSINNDTPLHRSTVVTLTCGRCEERLKRVFRHDGEGWKEIEWEDMQPGDEVLMLDKESVTDNLRFERCKIKGVVDQTKPGSPVEMENIRPLLPERAKNKMTISSMCEMIDHCFRRIDENDVHSDVLSSHKELLVFPMYADEPDGLADDGLGKVLRANGGQLVIRVTSLSRNDQGGIIADWQPEAKP
jgi:hypothetical protein